MDLDTKVVNAIDDMTGILTSEFQNALDTYTVDDMIAFLVELDYDYEWSISRMPNREQISREDAIAEIFFRAYRDYIADALTDARLDIQFELKKINDGVR